MGAHPPAPDSSSRPTGPAYTQNVESSTSELSWGSPRDRTSADGAGVSWLDKRETGEEMIVSSFRALLLCGADLKGESFSIMETGHEAVSPTTKNTSHWMRPRAPNLLLKKLLHPHQAALSKRNEAVSSNSTNSIAPPVKHIVGQANDKGTHVWIRPPMLRVCPESFSINFESIR